MRRATLGFLATLLFGAAPGEASTLRLEFELSPSTYAINYGPVPTTAPNGSALTFLTMPFGVGGSLVLRIEGVDESGALLGPTTNVSLLALSFQGGALASFAGAGDTARIDLDRLTQSGAARGVFDGSRIVFDAGQLAGQHAASTQCVGSLCGISVFQSLVGGGRSAGPFANTAAFALALSAFGQPGQAMLRAETFFPFFAGGVPVGSPFLQINGREVSRRIVPEPSASDLWALAVLALAGAALRRSRRALEPRAEHA